MAATAQMVELGEKVIFRDRQGLPKAAFVTGTRQTIDPQRANGEVPPINGDDELHLMVLSPAGYSYARHNIQRGSGPGQWTTSL